MNEQTQRETLARVLKELNQAWIARRYDKLRKFLHPNVVLATPGFGARVHGSDAYVEGHKDFADNAKIHDFIESAAEIDIVGDVAVVNYCYEMNYERSGKRYASTGRDLYVLHNTDDDWLVVWRTILDVDERAV